MTLMVAEAAERGSVASVRLLVTVRSQETGAYRAVGFLNQEPSGYRFAYLLRELRNPRFRPLPGLSRAVHEPVYSSELFPVFAERVIAARRPDRLTSLVALGLGPEADAFEVLARSHGQRVGDTIELLPAPQASAGDHVSLLFLTHGVRHLSDSSRARIPELHPGDPLRLEAEPDNPVNPRAQLVTDLDRVRLGWVPDPLVEVAQAVDSHIRVERANGPEVGFHFRLLVRLTGRVRHGQSIFTGPAWDV